MGTKEHRLTQRSDTLQLGTPAKAQAERVREVLKPFLKPTPLIAADALRRKTGVNVWLKLETQQPTGSFKVRPAFYGLLQALPEAKKHGVIACSSGNFAQALAFAARELGCKATLVMTDDTAPIKVERTRALGAEVVFSGPTFDSRYKKLEELKAERGSVALHSFDSEETIDADSTVGLELLDDLDGPFTVLVPASGGGLVAGISRILKESRPDCEVIALQPANGGAIARSIEAGKRINIGKFNTVADGLVASFPGERTFKLIQEHVDRIFLFEENEILKATHFLFYEQKLVVEPASALPVAALLSGQFNARHRDVVCVTTGGNLSPEILLSVHHD